MTLLLQVLESVNEIENNRERQTLETKLILLKIVIDRLQEFSYQDITSMFSNGAIFFVDGDSMLLHLMGDANYDANNGGQLLHLIYLCERHLQLFSRKGGCFEIIFFNIWTQAWSGKHTLLLARSALMSHLKFNMLCKVHEFDSIWDVNFKKILQETNCAFFLIDFHMMDTYSRLFAQEDYMLQELIFHVNICYSLMGLYLPCVDMDDIQLTVSTLNAFYCPPTVKLEHVKLRNLLHSIIQTIEEKCRSSLISSETVASPLISVEGERDVRYIVTVTAAAQFLKDSCAPQPQEDWIRAFLLYTSLLEVLPLKFRGCPSVVAHTTTFALFLEQIHRHMNCVLQAILHGNQTVGYNFDTVSDLWHGNLFAFIVNYVTEQEACDEFLLGTQTLTAYKKLLEDVVRLTEKPLMKFPLTIQRTAFSEQKNEGKESNSIKKTATLLPSCYELKQIVRTDCLLTFEFCKDLIPGIKKNEHENDSDVNITRNFNFEEKYHWHSKRLISDQYDHVHNTNVTPPMDAYERKRHDRIKKKYAHFMSIYGSSIEGRSDNTKSIVCESGNSRKKKGSKIKKLGKAAQKIIEDNCRKQQAKTEESDRKLFDSFKEKYRRYKERSDYSAALNEVKLLARKLKTKQVLQNALLYMVRILWCMWQSECETVCVTPNNLHYAKELFLVIRRILKDFESTALSDKDSELLGRCLWQMGLERIAQFWHLPEPSKRTSNQSYSIGMSWINFQLLHLGPELEREVESTPDSRVEGFMPDKWQRDLFDSVDKHQSVLVVAPTSSGKTYASYYCMEKVLRESNDGVVVYVAPTKALVNQVAATIYARFKNKDMPPGKSVYGVFTRDYRTNALNCQILVTVPECFALLLLSPRKRDWVRSLRYVIFDEIHCLAGQMGGFAWECGLLLIRCPFLALSATVEDPVSLHTWLQKMQDFKHSQDITNGCEKASDVYEVKLVVYMDRHADLRKHVYCEDKQFHHIHPYAYLDDTVVNEEKGIPRNITLSPEEVCHLYIAMNSVCPHDPRLRELHPEMFFSACTDGFISRNMVRNYEAELKKLLEKWAAEEDTAFETVVMQLRTVTEPIGNVSEKRFIETNFINFIQKLQEQNMLPAIVFSYSRQFVDWFFEHATEYYEAIAKKNEGTKKESKSVDRRRSGDDDGMQEWNSKDKRAGSVKKDDVSRRVTGRKKYEASLNLLQSVSAHSSLIRGVGHADEKVVEYVERRLMGTGYKKGCLFPHGLSLGIGMHHGGLDTKERSAVEMLFRMKFLNLVFATGTLALGVHMPCKTVAIVGDSPFLNPLEYHQMSGRAGRRGFDTAGNVVFMGLNERKMRMLLLGKLPCMVGNFPLNVTMVLRLLLMVNNNITCDGTHIEEVTSDSLSRYVYCLNTCIDTFTGFFKSKLVAQLFIPFFNLTIFYIYHIEVVTIVNCHIRQHDCSGNKHDCTCYPYLKSGHWGNLQCHNLLTEFNFVQNLKSLHTV
jgi:hypothetical protein